MFDKKKMITNKNGKEGKAVIGARYHFTDFPEDMETLVESEIECDTAILSHVTRDCNYKLHFVMSNGDSWDCIYPYEEPVNATEFNDNKIISKDNASTAKVGKLYYFSDSETMLKDHFERKAMIHSGILQRNNVPGNFPFLMQDSSAVWKFVYPVDNYEPHIINRQHRSEAVVGQSYYYGDSEGALKLRVAKKLKSGCGVLEEVDSHRYDVFLIKGAYWKYIFPVEATEEVPAEAPAKTEAYSDRMQAFIAKYDIHNGDIVKIVKKVKSREDGWRNEWVRSMDETVGRTGVVELMHLPSSYDLGLHVTVTDLGMHTYPFASLEFVEHADAYYTERAEQFKQTEIGKMFVAKHLESVIVPYLKNCVRHYRNYHTSYIPSSIRGSFVWSDTPEGHEYWNGIETILSV